MCGQTTKPEAATGTQVSGTSNSNQLALLAATIAAGLVSRPQYATQSEVYRREAAEEAVKLAKEILNCCS